MWLHFIVLFVGRCPTRMTWAPSAEMGCRVLPRWNLKLQSFSFRWYTLNRVLGKCLTVVEPVARWTIGQGREVVSRVSTWLQRVTRVCAQVLLLGTLV